MDDFTRIEGMLPEMEEPWRLLVLEAPDPILIVDRQGRTLFINHLPGGARLTTRGLLGQSILDQVLPEQRETVEAALAHVFTTGARTNYESAVRRADGSVIWYASHLGPLWHAGRVVAAMLIARDVTELKRIEKVKDNLLRDVSHELKTPLTKARLGLELLLERATKRPADLDGTLRYAQIALDGVQKLAQLVEIILDLSRLEAGAAGLASEPVSVDTLVSAAVEEMQPLASAKGLTLVACVGEGLPQVTGDRDSLARVLRNLIENACNFAAAGQIVVSADRQQHEILVSVNDCGFGILPENLERIFEEFYRERPELPGLGVGLAICKAIVEAHQGRIWAESPGRGRGTTLRFALPARL
jgi:PAS domain S-box-containing protein